jgi:hypothetical protein
VVTFNTPSSAPQSSVGGGSGGGSSVQTVTKIVNNTITEKVNTTQQKIIFAEQFISENPECAEIKEIIEEAKRSIISGNVVLAQEKVDQAIDGCRKLLSESAQARENVESSNILNILVIGSFASLILGLVFYFYKRYTLMKTLRGY